MTSSAIVKGDALEILPGLPPASYQCIIADPPYFNVLPEDWDQQWKSADDYLKWTSQWVSLCMRALKDDGLMFCFGQLGKREHVFIHAMSELCRDFQFHDLIIWDRAVGYDRRDSFSPAYEMILSLCKNGGPASSRRQFGSLMTAPQLRAMSGTRGTRTRPPAWNI